MKHKTIKICYLGDSITYGLGHDSKGVNKAKRWTALVDKILGRVYAREINFKSINLGVNGDTTRNGLERLKDVYAFIPDIMTIQFGMNDCNYWLTDNGLPRVNPASFRYNLREIIDKCGALGVKQIILSTNHLIPVKKLMLNGKDYNENNRFYNMLIRRIAKERGVFLCDIERFFKTYFRDKSYFLDENGKWVHLSAIGNSLYAKKMVKSFLSCKSEYGTVLRNA